MIIKLNTFKGQNKMYPAYAMPIELGQEATNTYIEDGTLTPMKEDSIFYLPDGVHVPEGTKSIYKHKNVNTAETEWHFFNEVSSVVRHPVGNDTHQRIYFVKEGKLLYKRFDWPTAYDVLQAQPNPQNQLTVIVNDGGAGDIQRFIAYTLVNNLGEESALSITTSGMDEYLYGNYRIMGLSEDSSITVTWDSNLIVPGGGNYEAFVKIRFYMTPVTTTASDDYRFAGEAYITDENILILNAGNDISIAESVASPVRLTYDEYANIALRGVCKTSFGSIITWDAGNIYVSDQKHPYRFSALSTYSIDSEILSINPFGTSFLVTTTTTPYVLTGTDPTAMLTEKAEQARGCLNKDCIVDMGNFICVPTDEGIYKIGTGSFELATKGMFSNANWDTIINNGEYLKEATQYKNLYILSLTTGDTLVFDFINGFFWQLDYPVYCGYYDQLEQILYYTVDGVPNTRLLMFNQDNTPRSYTYRTGKLLLNTPVNFKYARIFADDYNGTITLNAYDSGTLKFTKDITSDEITKIPSSRFSEVELEVISDRVINYINVSTTMEEMLGA